jgi:hypothetical protein
VPLSGLSTHSSQTDTPDIVFLLVLLPQFRVVDANSRIFQRVLYNNTFFRIEPAVNRLPTVAGGSIHAKEFLYTTPPPYEFEVQSETHGVDMIHPHNHSIHKLPHVSVHDVEFLPQSYGVVETYSETKW